MKVFYFAALVLSWLLISCNGEASQHSATLTVENAENYFFALDFGTNESDLSGVEDYFFTTFPHDDPTGGEVVYDRRQWMNDELIKPVKGDGLHLYLKARAGDERFDSFRITSKGYYNLNAQNQRILFVFKGNLPSGKGIWPAWWLNGSKEDLWTYQNASAVLTDAALDAYSGKGHFYDTPSAVNGTDWPAAGEVDIIETINGDSLIYNTIHTCPQMCNSEWNSNGEIINCANAKPDDPNAGCSGKPYAVRSPEGTFACLWEKHSFKFYYWPPDQKVRADGGPLSAEPDPAGWNDRFLKNEVRLLESDVPCNSNLHQQWQCNSCAQSNSCTFSNLKMILNTTLCGKWAGNEFDSTPHALQNCRAYISGEGRSKIDNQFLKIEYIAVKNLK